MISSVEGLACGNREDVKIELCKTGRNAPQRQENQKHTMGLMSYGYLRSVNDNQAYILKNVDPLPGLKVKKK